MDFWESIKKIGMQHKNLSILGSAAIITNIIGGIFWLSLAPILGPEKYGQLGYLISIGVIASTISFLGAGNTIVVLISKGIKIQSAISILTLSLSIISGIIIFIFLNDGSISIFIIGLTIMSLVTSEYLGLKLYKTYSKIIIFQKILQVSLAFSLYYFFDISGIILGIGLSFFPFVFRIYHNFKTVKMDFNIIRNKFSFMSGNYILDISRTLNGNVDKLIVAPIFGFNLLGNYSLAGQIFSVISIIPIVFYQYLLPKESNEGNSSKLKIFLVIISVILALLAVFLASLIIPKLFPNFENATLVTQIMSLAVIPLTINQIYIANLISKEDVKIVLVGSVIFIISQISGIILLGNLFGIVGVGYSFLISTSLETVYLHVIRNLKKY